MDLGGGYHGGQAPAVGGAHIHELDEAQGVPLLAGEGSEVQDLVLVDAALQDAVELEGREARRAGGLEPRQHPGEGQVRVAEGLEPVRTQGVEADGQAAQARRAEVGGQLRQQDAVGGEGQVLEAGHSRQHLHQQGQLPAQQGLAPGQADLGDAQAGEDPGQPGDLLEAEQGLPGQEGVVRPEGLPRHAVAAAEVAAVGDRDAQGLEGATQGVEGFHNPPSIIPCERSQ